MTPWLILFQCRHWTVILLATGVRPVHEFDTCYACPEPLDVPHAVAVFQQLSEDVYGVLQSIISQ